MFNKIKIENFRCFKSFELDQLGRVNLLVGLNNSGKTSVLEAIQLLCSRTDLEPLAEMMNHRGEYILSDNPRKTSPSELEIRHLFYKHEIDLDHYFSISGTDFNKVANNKIAISIKKIETQLSASDNNKVIDIEADQIAFFIECCVNSETFERALFLSPENGLSLDKIKQLSQKWRLQRRNKSEVTPMVTQFVRSSSLNTEEMMELFDLVVLTPQEKLVQEALQIIDKKIDRIASVNTRRLMYNSNTNIRDGFVVRLSDSNQRVPIGSLGDGTWRMLALALSAVCAEGGVLLVDEIDTGLHFTAMVDMWKLIWETAKKLNIQVFATTHNSDCWTSLATIASQDDTAGEGISIQRIERDKEKAVAFTEEEIVIAAERGIEVR